MFIEFSEDTRFKQKYIEEFAQRFSYFNSIVESECDKAEIYMANYRAFMNALDSKLASLNSPLNGKLSPYDIIGIANDVNKGIYEGYRKINVQLNAAKNFSPLHHSLIPNAMNELVYGNYHKIWDILDPYLREAKLHIALVQMQPFENGNKRTAKILTSINLIAADLAPIAIPPEQLDEYWSCIDNSSAEDLAELFRINSEAELKEMLELYKRMFTKPIVKKRTIK